MPASVTACSSGSSGPPFRFLGSISYGLYLWHTVVLRWSNKRGFELSLGERLVFTTAVTIALAYASYRMIELPAMSLRKRRARQQALRARPGPPPRL